MSEATPHVVDARLQEALDQYFNGVQLRATIGDVAVLSAIRKQNSAPVDVYTPSFEAAREDKDTIRDPEGVRGIHQARPSPSASRRTPPLLPRLQEAPVAGTSLMPGSRLR